MILFAESKNRLTQYSDNPSYFPTNVAGDDVYGPNGAFLAENILQFNIYSLMEIPFWSYFR